MAWYVLINNYFLWKNKSEMVFFCLCYLASVITAFRKQFLFGNKCKIYFIHKTISHVLYYIWYCFGGYTTIKSSKHLVFIFVIPWWPLYKKLFKTLTFTELDSSMNIKFLIVGNAFLEHLSPPKLKIFFPAANHGGCRKQVTKVPFYCLADASSHF